MTSIRCARCGATPATPEQGLPWCATCGIWLVRDEPTGEWVGVAERQRRRKRARDAVAIQETHDLVHGGLAAARSRLPEGWRGVTDLPLPGAIWSLTIQPPGGPVQVEAYLVPSDTNRGWYVRIHNRTEGVGFPLYTPGGAHAAHYATLDQAVDAAVTALRTEPATG